MGDHDKEKGTVNRFGEPAKGDTTPWGEVWSWSRVVDGVFWVSTPAHGGLLIDQRLAEEVLTAQARGFGRACDSWLCFEEDCEVTIPLFEHPEWAPNKRRVGMAEYIRTYFPAYFSAPPYPTEEDV